MRVGAGGLERERRGEWESEWTREMMDDNSWQPTPT